MSGRGGDSKEGWLNLQSQPLGGQMDYKNIRRQTWPLIELEAGDFASGN
jgi:hypothetical protein